MGDRSPASEELMLEREGAVLVITLNRPKVRNAINHRLACDLAAAIDHLDADDGLRVGILTGKGGTFSSGLDLKAFLNGEAGEVSGKGFAGLTEAPPAKPLIAAVEGFALAGGCEMVLTCDLVVAADDAQFGLPEVKRGLIAGSGGLLRLPLKIPPQVAMEYALTGENFSATEAHRWGMVNRLVAPGGALAAARELAAKIAENAPLAVQLSKEILGQAHYWSETEGRERQRRILAQVFSSEDAQEGSAAFLEKRPPVWRGR